MLGSITSPYRARPSTGNCAQGPQAPALLPPNRQPNGWLHALRDSARCKGNGSSPTSTGPIKSRSVPTAHAAAQRYSTVQSLEAGRCLMQTWRLPEAAVPTFSQSNPSPRAACYGFVSAGITTCSTIWPPSGVAQLPASSAITWLVLVSVTPFFSMRLKAISSANLVGDAPASATT